MASALWVMQWRPGRGGKLAAPSGPLMALVFVCVAPIFVVAWILHAAFVWGVIVPCSLATVCGSARVPLLLVGSCRVMLPVETAGRVGDKVCSDRD